MTALAATAFYGLSTDTVRHKLTRPHVEARHLREQARARPTTWRKVDVDDCKASHRPRVAPWL